MSGGFTGRRVLFQDLLFDHPFVSMCLVNEESSFLCAVFNVNNRLAARQRQEMCSIVK